MSSLEEIANSLSVAERVIADPMRFKARLEIGEAAYQTLDLRNKALELWDVAGVAMTGASVAKSATVASAFFTTTTSSFFGLVGVTTAVTPIGWVIAASVATGGAYFGVMRLMKGLDEDRVEVVPKFINTPIDVLAVGLFDLVAPLALKIAAADGRVSDEERTVIGSYFIDEWGYDPAYVTPAMALFESRLEEFTLKRLTEGLRSFTRESSDFNHKKVRKKFIELLTEIAEADGHLHEMEELAIKHVADSLPKDPWLRPPKFAKKLKLGRRKN
ncbi:TerB family tellurite resistance protein [Shimia thalassica]|uniref:TerB family tellurite resistance protein n=1 Tax=Shimia thalassica TaxID=1715693 RepID=UPI0026E37CE2|nr:TerB family tellurite resistance protein [Shimia thalassica]MDO6478450.1 TerB family tellurite resistance protein [Shimia thalassica]